MGGPDNEPKKRFFESLTREKKITVGVLMVCGIIAIVLSIVQVRRTLNRPFTASLSEFIAFQRTLGPSDAEKEQKLKETDTDGDGISDWSELNVYHTSPYLADSDSDGIPDNIEIARGTDPNCAEGQTCDSAFGATATASSTVTADSLGATAPTAQAGDASAGVPPRDPAAIRQFLKMRGMSDTELGQYSDDALLQAYDSAAYGQAGSATGTTAGTSSDAPSAADGQTTTQTNGSQASPQ